MHILTSTIESNGRRVRLATCAVCAIAVAMAALACALAGALATPHAFAASASGAGASTDEIGVWTATVTSAYENPDTGEIADSGGESSKALGQSMVEGVSQPNALIEKDGTGSVLVTVRFYEASELGDVNVAFDEQHDGSFTDAGAAAKVSEDADANMADFQFSVPTEEATLQFRVYVEPMGREVVFFTTLSDLTEGNTAGFAQTIDPDALKAAAEEAAQAEAEAQKAAAEEQQEKVSQATGASSGQASQDGPDVGLIVVGVVVAVVVIGVIVALAARKRKA